MNTRHNPTEADNLTPRQRRFVGALLTARTIAEAAAAVGCSARTGERWARLPAVQSALRDAQGEALAQTARRAFAALSMALDVLQNIMADPGAPTGARVSAARCVLESASRIFALQDLTARVEALEAFDVDEWKQTRAARLQAVAALEGGQDD